MSFDLYIRFVDGGGWDSKLIKAYERFSDWSHVEFYFPTDSYTFGAQLDGGVKERSIFNDCYSKVVKVEVWRIEVSEDEYTKAKELMNEVDGTKYDILGILTFPLGSWRHHTKGRLICSGTVAHILKGIGKAVLDQPDDYYDPADIHLLVQQIGVKV